MTVKSILLTCALVTTLCFQESNAQSTGDVLDPNKCIRSAGDV